MWNIMHYIPGNEDFLLNFANGMLSKFGHLGPEIGKVTIILPTKRSCRKLAQTFFHISEKKACFLPRIYPLQDIELSYLLEQVFSCNITEDQPNLLEHLRKKIAPEMLEMSILQGLCGANGLANHLYSLFYEIQKHQLGNIIEKIQHHYSDHLDQIIELLKFIIEALPQKLHKLGLIDKASYVNEISMILAITWEKYPPKYPVIIAGIDGETASDRALLKVVNEMRNGYVVLHNIDKSLPNAEWQEISHEHPQYQLKSLIDLCRVGREEIYSWHNIVNVKHNDIFFSKSFSRNFSNCAPPQDLTIIETETPQQELQFITQLCVDKLICGNESVLIVTQNELLIEKLTYMLLAHNVIPDCSIGNSALKCDEMIFLQLIMRTIFEHFSPISLLALLKHDLCKIAQKEVVQQFEISHLRGINSYKNLQELIAATDEEIKQILQLILEHSRKLEEIMSQKTTDFGDILSTHLELAERLSANSLWQHERGVELRELLLELSRNAHHIGKIAPISYLAIMRDMLSKAKFRTSKTYNPRLIIITPKESQLLCADNVILADLNENSWPQKSSSNIFLNDILMQSLGFENSEIETGRNAAKFYNLLHNKNIYLTRSKTSKNIITTSSRWLLRIKLLLQKIAYHEQPALNLSPEILDIIELPLTSPTPPVEFRLKSLSVTQVEKLIRNPYDIYASKILRLYELEPINKDPENLDYGNLIHEAIHHFTLHYKPPTEPYKFFMDFILQKGRDLFYKPAIRNVWLPKIEKIARWFIEYHLDNMSCKLLPETELQAKFGDFTLKARLDRMEVREGNCVTILDYKTGKLPGKKDIADLVSIQLPLEALLAQKNGYIVTKLLYLQLNSQLDEPVLHELPEPTLLITKAEAKLLELIEFYKTQEHGYDFNQDYQYSPYKDLYNW